MSLGVAAYVIKQPKKMRTGKIRRLCKCYPGDHRVGRAGLFLGGVDALDRLAILALVGGKCGMHRYRGGLRGDCA